MKIYKITEASEYLGVSINTLKTLANNGKINSFKTSGEHRRFRQDALDAYMGIEKEKQEKLTVILNKMAVSHTLENIPTKYGLKQSCGTVYFAGIFKCK